MISKMCKQGLLLIYNLKSNALHDANLLFIFIHYTVQIGRWAWLNMYIFLNDQTNVSNYSTCANIKFRFEQ